MKKFKNSNKKSILIICTISIVLLTTAILICRTYAIYQEYQNWNAIKGKVPNQDYDLKFTFLLEDENGNKTYLNDMPDEKIYHVTISCNNNATGVWDYESWGLKINNLNKIHTKCNLSFKRLNPLQSFGINEPLTDNGNGLYQTIHTNNHIDYSTDYNAIEMLKQTEYRYAGGNPNNYITFNDELWRIIGLVNTPEGQRIKIIRDESIGGYSWDSSESSINYGWGINEWSQSKIMKLLNEGAYFNRTSGECYNNENNQTIPCNFINTGLTNNAKEMIDTMTWNTGSQYKWVSSITNGLTKHHYENERSSATGKSCSGLACNDNVTRTTTWIGKVGLMYPSDYGYATSGGDITNREECLNKILYNEWNKSDNNDCKMNNWLHKNSDQWTIIPTAAKYDADLVMSIKKEGNVDYKNAYNKIDTYPSVYLKDNIKITKGKGERNNPYILSKL